MHPTETLLEAAAELAATSPAYASLLYSAAEHSEAKAWAFRADAAGRESVLGKRYLAMQRGCLERAESHQIDAKNAQAAVHQTSAAFDPTRIDAQLRDRMTGIYQGAEKICVTQGIPTAGLAEKVYDLAGSVDMLATGWGEA